MKSRGISITHMQETERFVIFVAYMVILFLSVLDKIAKWSLFLIHFIIVTE